MLVPEMCLIFHKIMGHINQNKLIGSIFISAEFFFYYNAFTMSNFSSPYNSSKLVIFSLWSYITDKIGRFWKKTCIYFFGTQAFELAFSGWVYSLGLNVLQFSRLINFYGTSIIFSIFKKWFCITISRLLFLEEKSQ